MAGGGIGCHGMAVWMPDTPHRPVTQMGGEGANWIGDRTLHRDVDHIFQNLGDGTYFHSGLLAIRAERRRRHVNITYKVLVERRGGDDGWPAHRGRSMEGEITVPGDRAPAPRRGREAHRGRERTSPASTPRRELSRTA